MSEALPKRRKKVPVLEGSFSIEQLMGLLETNLKVALQSNTSESLLALEACLLSLQKKGAFPLEREIVSRIEASFIEFRYILAPQAEERMAIVDRLEASTGIVPEDAQYTEVICSCIHDSLGVKNQQHPEEVAAYLDRVMERVTRLGVPIDDRWLQEVTRRCLYDLANDQVNSNYFLGQVAVFKKWNLFERDLNFAENRKAYSAWIKRQVFRQGLSFDVRGAEQALQLHENYSYQPELREYGRGREERRKRALEIRDVSRKQDAFQKLADLVSDEYASGGGGTPMALKVLLEADANTDLKEHIFVQLIHCTSVSHWNDFIESFSKLSLSPERETEIAQELYAYYIKSTKCVPDRLSIKINTPVQWDHPVIQAAFLDVTSEFIGKNLRNIAQLDKDLANCPCALPYNRWPAYLQEAFQDQFIGTAGIRETQRVVERSVRWGDPAQRKDVLLGLIEYETDMPLRTVAQWVTRSFDQIPEFCNRDVRFKQSYQRWLANALSEYQIWPLTVAREIPGAAYSEWEPSDYWGMIAAFLKNERFPELEKLSLLAPERAEMIEKCIDQKIEARLAEALNYYDQGSALMEYLLEKRQGVLKAYIQKTPKHTEAYQRWVANIYLHRVFSGVLEKAPWIDFESPFLQIAIAKRYLKAMRSDEPEEAVRDTEEQEPYAKKIQWQNSELEEEIKENLQGTLAALGRGLQKDRKNIFILAEKLKGYLGSPLTDARHWEGGLKEARNIFATMKDIEAWESLADAFGAKPGEWEKILALFQEATDRICALTDNKSGNSADKAEHFLAVKKRFGIQPSEQALRLRFTRNMSVLQKPGDSLELFRAFGVTPHFTPEEISAFPVVPLRTEALFSMIVLPKSGPERALAEKALRGRSWMADIIPQLLAIQSPTRREEFCPYKLTLEPMLHILKGYVPSFEDPAVKKSLLFFLQRFGIHYTPTLAINVMNLFLQTQNGRYPVDETAFFVPKFRSLLGFTADEHPSFEGYLERVESLIREIRQTILTDAPLEARIEQSALGMELFNMLVPHVGSYKSVEDRPQLLSMARQNRENLRVKPIYTALEKPVRIVDQHTESVLGEDRALVIERGIRACREQRTRKIQDETLQRFLGGWEKAAIEVELEPTGSSRAFWFAPLQAWFQEREEILAKKIEGLTHQIALERTNKELARVQLLREAVTRLMEVSDPGTPEQLLEELQSLYVNLSGKVDRVALEAEAGETARALALVIMKAHSPLHFQVIKTIRGVTTPELLAHFPSGEPLLPSTHVSAWGAWFTEEYLEHFAGIRPDAQVPLSDVNRRLLQKLWRIDGFEEEIKHWTPTSKPIAHPILGPLEAVRRLDEEVKRLEQSEIVYEEKSVGFWPVKGVGRALSGDIADACFHGYRNELIRGEFPGLTAVLMTLPEQQEIAGSVLFIEAKTADKSKNVLVIRALNPTEAVTRRSLHARSLVEATIEYAKEIALRSQGTPTPISEIRLCYDHRGGHSTNREEIFQAMKELIEHHGWNSGDELANTPETNFNGYRIYGEQATRVVWSLDE